MKRSLMVDGNGIPLDRVLAPANRHDSPLLAPTLDKLGPLPEEIAELLAVLSLDREGRFACRRLRLLAIIGR